MTIDFNIMTLGEIKDAILAARAAGKHTVDCLVVETRGVIQVTKYGIEWIKNASRAELILQLE